MDKEARYSVDLNEILNAAVEAKNNRIDAVEYFLPFDLHVEVFDY